MANIILLRTAAVV